jgi:hypothetical protein
MTTPPGAAGTKTAPAQKNAPPPQVFRVGVYETDTPDIDVTLVSSAAAQKLGTFKLSPNGWLAGAWCLFEGTGFTAGSYAGDNPVSGIQKVTFRDVGNREIIGPLTGFEWAAVNKTGGYFPGNPDWRNPATGFSATSTGFAFLLWLPLELVYRDTLGEIENKSSSSSYTLEIYIDSTANTATVTGTITWRMRANLYGYTEPEAADSHGRPFSQAPPAAGTVQYWASEVYNSPAGLGKYNQQNGIGYSIRNLLYINYDNAAGTRAAGYNFTLTAAGAFTGGDWPDPLTLSFGKVQLVQRPAKMWANLMAKWLGLTALGPDTAMSLDNGVFFEAFNREFDTIAGNELRNGYLVTKAGNVLQIQGTFALADNVHIVTNYVVPPGNDAARLRAR